MELTQGATIHDRCPCFRRSQRIPRSKATTNLEADIVGWVGDQLSQFGFGDYQRWDLSTFTSLRRRRTRITPPNPRASETRGVGSGAEIGGPPPLSPTFVPYIANASGVSAKWMALYHNGLVRQAPFPSHSQRCALDVRLVRSYIADPASVDVIPRYRRLAAFVGAQNSLVRDSDCTSEWTTNVGRLVVVSLLTG